MDVMFWIDKIQMCTLYSRYLAAAIYKLKNGMIVPRLVR